VKLRARPGPRVWRRYWLLQIPGQAAVLGLALAAWHWLGAPGWMAWGVPLAWVLKDALMFPVVWRAYEPDDEVRKGPIGEIAVAEEPLDPKGWARLGPGLWRAELAPGSAPAPRGARLRVVAVDGLVLRVEPL
jgi:membrane protein implicated in regulation of membrane protease activity